MSNPSKDEVETIRRKLPDGANAPSKEEVEALYRKLPGGGDKALNALVEACMLIPFLMACEQVRRAPHWRR